MLDSILGIIRASYICKGSTLSLDSCPPIGAGYKSCVLFHMILSTKSGLTSVLWCLLKPLIESIIKWSNSRNSEMVQF